MSRPYIAPTPIIIHRNETEVLIVIVGALRLTNPVREIYGLVSRAGEKEPGRIAPVLYTYESDRLLSFGFRKIAFLFQLFKIGFRFGLQG